MSDTTELRDWHARRAGWEWTEFSSGNWYWVRGDMATHAEWPHPFPHSIDAADASFPQGWEWGRTPPRGDWCAVSLARGMTEQTAYTGDKVADLYALSRMAWEQEASNEQATR